MKAPGLFRSKTVHRFVAAFFIALSLMPLAEEEPLPPTVSTSITPLALFRSIREDPDAVAFSPDGGRLLSASGFELLLWDVASAKPIRDLQIPGMFRQFTACAFSPDGRTILAGSNDGRVATWNAETGKLIKVLRSEDWMYDCVFSKDGTQVLSVYQSGRITFREMATGRILWEDKKTGSVNGCDLSADGKRAVTATESAIEFRDASTGEILSRIDQPGSSMYDKTVALSPDGKRIASPVKDSAAAFVILDTSTGRILHTCKGHTNSIRFLDFSPDGSMIASASADNTLKLWISATGRLIRTFSGHKHDVSSAAFPADGTKVLSASRDLSMKLWDFLIHPTTTFIVPPSARTASG